MGEGHPSVPQPQGHPVPSGFGADQRGQLGCTVAKGGLTGHHRDGESGSFNSLIKFTESLADGEGFQHCVSSGIPGWSWLCSPCRWSCACKCFKTWEGEGHRGVLGQGGQL